MFNITNNLSREWLCVFGLATVRIYECIDAPHYRAWTFRLRHVPRKEQRTSRNGEWSLTLGSAPFSFRVDQIH